MKVRRVNGKLIRYKMFRYCLILIMLPLAAIGLSSYWMYSRVVENKIERYEKKVLQQMQDNIESRLANVRTVARSISINSDLQEIFRKYRYMERPNNTELTRYCLNMLRSCMYTNDSIRSICIWSEEQEMSVGNIGTVSGEYRKTRQMIDDYLQNRETQWYYVDQEEGYVEQMLTYVMEMKDYYKGNEEIAVIAVNVSDAALKEVFDRMEKSPGSYYFLAGPDTYIYGTSPAAAAMVGAGQLKNITEEHYGLVDFQKERYVIFGMPVGGTRWKIYSAIPLSDYRSEVRTIRMIITVVGIVSILAAIVLTARFSRKLTLPINNLVSEMKRVQGGDFEISTDYEYEEDEIGFLKQRFDEMLRDIRRLIGRIHEQEERKRRAELNALQAQINPHFLYNTLNSINCLAQIENQKEISEIIVELGSLLRISISSQNEFITIGQEIDYIKKYMWINNVRYNGRFALTVTLPGELEGYYMPKMLLQPLVENSLLHGFEGAAGECGIDITVQDAGENIRITVADNGRGIEPGQLSDINDRLKKGGKSEEQIGIYNVNTRLKLHFEPEYGLLFTAREKGVAASVLLPRMEEGSGNGTNRIY